MVGAAQFQGLANNHHNHQQQLQQQQQQQAVALPTQPPPLPPGWVAATDPVSGHVYYGWEISWEPPRMPIPVPHPPPPPPVHVVVSPIHASSPAPASNIHAIHHHHQQQHHLSQQPMQVLPWYLAVDTKYYGIEDVSNDALDDSEKKLTHSAEEVKMLHEDMEAMISQIQDTSSNIDTKIQCALLARKWL